MHAFSDFMDIPLNYTAWIDLLETLLNSKVDLLQRMIFNLLDYNQDRSVCQVDLFALMKFYENDDEVFINSFSYDICKIVAAIY